ncbi:WD40-like Beta Propeller Repeat [Ekhidna lutea]|uniref:WD40-like Beta Propeller Repeat n=1 Tax=Ekhidna lutea TaxID=447679 RepID=A0A239K877_EKHLU|nr:OmpA family protein [Ekhidna lutea]SNT14676.1 WD40-like Beta Propeller Repeat [Ekhidna lutea]
MENIATDTQVHGYSIIRLIGTFLLLTLSISLLSQSPLSTDSKKARKLYEKADKKYKERDFASAISFLEESVQEDSEFFEAYIRMGSLYNALGNEDSVYSKFKSHVKYAPEPIASVLEKLAFMAQDRGEYEKAQTFIDSFLSRVPERGNADDIQLLLKSIKFSKDQISVATDSIAVTYLPKEVNRFRLQYLPSITIDNASLFYTKRDHVQGDEDIVVSKKIDGRWTPGQSVSPRINSPLNEGACTVSADGRTMIFTSCDDQHSFGSCDLYITKKVGDNWSKPKNLGKPVNSMYWESQPSLSADGRTLYFSSNRSGGFGGRDLWVTKNENGKWKTPVNLGPEINTRRDETTPFIHPNGKQLYFSANGYPGMGGYDLYYSNRLDSNWSAPQNLGYPINTHKDEVAIVISSDGESAFFAKEEQKNFEILDSKIVSIQLSEEVKAVSTSYIVGTVTNVKSNQPLSANVQVVNLETNETIYGSKSDSITGEYYMVLPVGLELAAYVKKKGFIYSDFHFETEVSSLVKPDTINIALQPIEIGESLVLKNIYFELDSYELDDKSISEIQNAFDLLEENPSIVVEISGHTDDIGSTSYNENLSRLRAKAVYEKLKYMGIASDRLEFKGYADTQPLYPNTSESNRQSNRRIEFRVIRTRR